MRSSSSSPCLREDKELDLVDRIRLTQPIWHRTTTSRAAAVHLLLNKPPGTFIIRDAVERRDACLMLSTVISSHPKTRVSHDPIHKSPPQEGSRLQLSNSLKAFPDLTSLVAFYCSSGDSDEQLPHLVLPTEILEAKSRQRLLALAQLGHYFWIPSLFGKSYSLPEEVSISVSDEKTLDATRRDYCASQRSLCSTPSSESIVSSHLMSDGEEATANHSRSAGHQNRSTTVDDSGSSQDLLRISGGFRKTLSGNRSGYVSSSESGSDIVNGMIYYRSDLPDKLSDYEDIWPSPESNKLPCTFPVSDRPSSPPRLPTPFTINCSLSSPVSLLFSSLNHASSKCLSVTERQMLTSEGSVAVADVHYTRSSQTQKEVSRIDLTKYQLNSETGAKKNQPMLGFPQQLQFPRQGRRIRSKKSLPQNRERVQEDAQQQQKENCSYNVTNIECQRLETTGVFHFDFQQTSRLASHVAKITKNSPLYLTSPDYALPYDALPCDALPGAMKDTAASFNRSHSNPSQRYPFTSRVDRNHRTLAAAPLPLRNSLAPGCNHDNRNNTAVQPVNPDFRNTAYYRFCRNNRSSMMSKTEIDESRMQRLRPTVSDPKHCFRDNMKSDDETMMELGYRLPFDALPFGVSLISHNQGVGQLLPPNNDSQAVLASSDVSVCRSSQAEQGSIKEAHGKCKMPRTKSLRASFSAIQRKILGINQKIPRPQESLSCTERPKTETLSVPLIHNHLPNGESQLPVAAADGAGAMRTVVMSEDETLGNSTTSLRRHAFQVVNLKRRRSVYDNVSTPSYYPLLNPGDIPKHGNISPYLGDRDGDSSSYGDGSLPRSRRMTAASQMTTFSTATEYCQPWETIRWSQLLAQNSISNSPSYHSVQDQCNRINPINGVPSALPTSLNEYCAEAGQVIGKGHRFPEETNGTAGVCWSQRMGNSDFSKSVASKSVDQTNFCTTDHRFSVSVHSNNLQCNLTNDLRRRINNSAKETDGCELKSKVMTCGAVPFSEASSTADVNCISRDKMPCRSGNVSRYSFSETQNSRGDNQETLLTPMSPDVIPQSASVQEPSPCRGGGGWNEETTATRIYNYIVQMSQRREGFLGKMIENFIECTRNATEKNPRNIVRNVRQFMTGLKNYLINRGEDDLNNFIRSESEKMTLSEFLNIGVILERVFEDCIVHPLQEHIYQLFVQAYTRDGQLQLMSDGIKFAKRKASLAELGLPLESSCEGAVARAIHFLTMMEKSHSHSKKFLFLQAAIRAIDSEVEMRKDLESRDSVRNTEGLVSSLVRILLEKNFTSAQIELDYMQGLMDMTSSVTSSESSYHLGLFSCAIELIKNTNQNRPSATNNNANHNPAAILSDALLTVYIPDEKYNNVISVGIPLQPNSVTKDICDMVAYKMRVTNPQDYGLFLLTEGTEIHLSDLMKISEILSAEKVKASTAESPSRLIYRRVSAKFIWSRNL